jgi:hypothetical protein
MTRLTYHYVKLKRRAENLTELKLKLKDSL